MGRRAVLVQWGADADAGEGDVRMDGERKALMIRGRPHRLRRFGVDEALHHRRIMWSVQRGLVAMRGPVLRELDYWLGRHG